MAGEGTCYLLQSSLLQELKQGAVDHVLGDIVSLNITYEAFLREKVGTDHASKFILWLMIWNNLVTLDYLSYFNLCKPHEN